MLCGTLSNKIGNRKVIIYGAGILGTEALNVLLQLKKEILYFVDRSEVKQKQEFHKYAVKSPENILHEKESVAIVVALNKSEEVQIFLENIGLAEGIDFFIWESWIQGSTCEIGNMGNDFQGFEKILYYDKTHPGVILLGNSTTVSAFYEIKSWSDYLLELFKADGVEVNIYNGAIVGYSSLDEALKLISAGIDLKPTIVISYSGIIDFAKPSNTNNAGGGYIARGWQQNEKVMRAVCNEFGIAFMGILQPSIYTRNIDSYNLKSENEIRAWSGCKKTVNERIENLYQEAINLIQDEEQLYDMTGMFDKETDIYFGRVHTNEKGNRIIAKKIYELLMNKYQQRLLP